MIRGVLLEIINFMGDILAESIRISPPAARGLLKLAIKDELDPFRPINQIKLEELELVIQNALKNRLKALEIPSVDSIVSMLLNTLTENQSLITMAVT